jgi:dolichyl-phosphate beta-glucosyltransferase
MFEWMSSVTLVVPCYNEADRLPADVFANFALPGEELRFLFVNDGSSDDTSVVLKELCERLGGGHRSLDLPANVGKAEAVRAGILSALDDKPDFVGYWDADLATSLDEIERFCEVLQTESNIELVLGARVKMLGRRIQRQTYRHIYGRVFATIVSKILALAVYDTQCGAKFIRVTDDTRGVFAEPFVSRWIFDVELLARYIVRWESVGREASDHIHEIPLRAWEDVGGSKVKPIDGVIAAADLMKIANRHKDVLSERRARLGEEI